MSGKLWTVPYDDRRSPEVDAQIRAVEAQKLALFHAKKGIPDYMDRKKELNKEIMRLSKIGLPLDLSWRNDDGRPPFLKREQSETTVRLENDQREFCRNLSGKDNISMGIRMCIDFTMSARQLPILPKGLEDDE